MDKLAFVFPGQASQYIGMGKEFYDKYSIAKETFDSANDILGYDLKKIIFEGPLDLLTQTKYTQPAVFTTSVVCLRVFNSNFQIPISSYFSAGHSLGEYAAIVSAGVLSFEDGLKLVNRRAEFIQNACEEAKGTMLAILGAERSIVEEICTEAGKLGVCEAVNFNAPDQIVISGETAAIEKAKQIAKTKKVKAIPLSVSGAFHSSLMKKAQVKMTEEVLKYSFKNPKNPIITNCDAEITTIAEKIAEKLVKQITLPVLWVDSIKKMISGGCETFVEFGPKNVISGMIRKISPVSKTLNIENEITLANTLEALKCVNRN
ncbi:MAG: ACP S-malonyltransferase [Elusimicrobia bacterium]|nr:ACP S-malonyltransferase [Elusimicrobiota bacterium]